MHNTKKGQIEGYAAYHDTQEQAESAPIKTDKVTILEVMDDDPSADKLPDWLSGDAFLSQGKEMRDVLIGGPDGGEAGGLLRQQSKLVLGGGSKMGKTWILLDLALAVACGGKWLNHFKCKQGRVLYINLELHPDTAGHRANWVGETRGYIENGSFKDETNAKNFNAWNLRGHCYDLSTMLSAMRMRLAGQKKGAAFDLLIVDPIYKTYNGIDENAAGDIAELMLSLENFAKESSASIAFAAHHSKGAQSGKEAMDRISGSGVFARDADAIVTFTPHEEEDHHVLEASLREFPPISPLVVSWSAPVAQPASDMDPTRLRAAGKLGASKGPERAAAVADYLGAESTRADVPIRVAIAGAMNKQTPPETPTEAGIRSWRKSMEGRPEYYSGANLEVIKKGNRELFFRIKKSD